MSPTTKNLKPKSILKNKAQPKVTKEIPKTKNITPQISEESIEEDENLEGLSDLDEDDEVDVADISSGEDASSEDELDEEELEEQEDESFPLKKKQKKNKDDGSESFATAFNSIVNSKIKAYDRKDPILARNKITLKKLESEKLENKAKKAILAEKKQFQDKHRIKQLLPITTAEDSNENIKSLLSKERSMKKIAQKGVVKLFNAVLSTQIKTTTELNNVKMGVSKKEELMTDVSKEKFLDLIAAAGGEE
ncbi:RRP15 [Candida jiufengensis]|uniref:RRP15 n=1 Tax=Candida jiufengensis TaxID=497108 RepID=UPI002224F52B|nr:RRP15 [Candida jiufengensis]KAI5952395.1 RRP15 [Candida jiufengensis]